MKPEIEARGIEQAVGQAHVLSVFLRPEMGSVHHALRVAWDLLITIMNA